MFSMLWKVTPGLATALASFWSEAAVHDPRSRIVWFRAVKAAGDPWLIPWTAVDAALDDENQAIRTFATFVGAMKPGKNVLPDYPGVVFFVAHSDTYPRN